jgi:hypothetical protein
MAFLLGFAAGAVVVSAVWWSALRVTVKRTSDDHVDLRGRCYW